MPTPPTIGGRLTQLRAARGWSRPKVHDEVLLRWHVDLPAKTLENWEKDVNEPTASMLANLARLYDVSLDYLFTGRRGELDGRAPGGTPQADTPPAPPKKRASRDRRSGT